MLYLRDGGQMRLHGGGSFWAEACGISWHLPRGKGTRKFQAGRTVLTTAYWPGDGWRLSVRPLHEESWWPCQAVCAWPGGERFSLTSLSLQQHWTHLTTLLSCFLPCTTLWCSLPVLLLRVLCKLLLLYMTTKFCVIELLIELLSPMALVTVVIRYLSVWLFVYMLYFPLLACKLILCTSPWHIADPYKNLFNELMNKGQHVWMECGNLRGVIWEDVWLVSFCSSYSVGYDRRGTEIGDEM